MFIERAHLLSLRAESIPREYAESFRILRSHVAACSPVQITAVIRQEFGMLPQELWGEFELTAFAAGSYERGRYEETIKIRSSAAGANVQDSQSPRVCRGMLQ